MVSGSARAKETLEWLSNDIFGKVVQVKKGVTIDRDKTSINLNENMDALYLPRRFRIWRRDGSAARRRETSQRRKPALEVR